MAAPVVHASNAVAEPVDTTSHDIDMTSVAASDRAVLMITLNGLPTLSGFPAGWVQILRYERTAHVTEWWEKIGCSGAEASFAVTSSSSERSVGRVFLVSGGHGVEAMEFATPSFGTDAAPDPPNLSASWGAEENLWIAAESRINTDGGASAYPLNYSANQFAASDGGTAGGQGVTYAICTRPLAAASENPGTFLTGGGRRWAAFTMVIRPGSAGGAAVSHAHTVTASGVKTVATGPVGEALISVAHTETTVVHKKGAGSAVITQPHSVLGPFSANAAITHTHTVTASGTKDETSIVIFIEVPSLVSASGEGRIDRGPAYTVRSDEVAIHHIRQGDTDPNFRTQLTDADGLAVDLTDATVEFHAVYENSTTVKINAAATPDPDQSLTGSRGFVEYSFVVGDTDIAGRFWCEWEVTYPTAQVQTFPTRGHDLLLVYGEIA